MHKTLTIRCGVIVHYGVFFLFFQCFYDTICDFIFTYWIRASKATACTLKLVRSLIHWFNYFGNHSVVVFINAFIGLCGALRNDFLLFVAYSCSEVWNWLFFRVNKSDIRVKWAFRFYLLHSLLFPLSPCASMRRNSSQSQLRLHWERQCHLSNFDTDGGASGKNPFRNETEKKAQMNFQSMYRTAYFLFNLKWTIAIGNINWEKKTNRKIILWAFPFGFASVAHSLILHFKSRTAASPPSFNAIENKTTKKKRHIISSFVIVHFAMWMASHRTDGNCKWGFPHTWPEN